MKSKIKKIIVMILTLVLATVSVASLSACDLPTESSKNDVIVTSNGGTTVVVTDKDANDDGTLGDEVQYVYFINGIANYSDASGETNNYGKVTKGGLYRAKVVSNRQDYSYYENLEKQSETYSPTEDLIAEGLLNVLDFDYEKLSYKDLGLYTIGSETEDPRITDADGTVRPNYIATNGGASEYRIEVEPVIKKKIGTNGYEDGGFWIFDNMIYYATPNADKNADGEVEYTKADFYCYNIDTKSNTHLYTTKQADDTIPYYFCKQNGRVYLTTFEKYYANSENEDKNILTGYLVTNTIVNGNVVEKKEIVENVESVCFPKSDSYDPSAKVNQAEDFIYFTRKATKTDSVREGYVAEMVSPDGSLRSIVTTSLSEISLYTVKDGYLYYRDGDSSGLIGMYCTNLYTQFKALGIENGVQSMVRAPYIINSNVNDYKGFCAIPQDNPLTSMSMIAYDDSGVYILTSDGTNYTKQTLYSGTFVVEGYFEGKLYGRTNSTFASIDLNNTSANGSVTTLVNNYTYESAGMFHLDMFSIDYTTAYSNNTAYKTTETYAAMFANYYDTATNYMVLKKIDGIYNPETTDGLVFGEVDEAEWRTITCYDENCINWRHDHSSWDTTDTTPDEEEDSGYTN